MKKLLSLLALLPLLYLGSCYSVDTTTSSGAPPVKYDESRFHVSLVDGEICSADSMANAVYCENSDETRAIEATIIIKYTTENGVPVQENKVVIVQPNQKVYVGCPAKDNSNVYYQYTIATSHYL